MSRQRSIVGVALVIVLALVAAACGSSNSSSPSAPAGAKENTAISGNDWPFTFVQENGQPLDTITDSSGATAQKMVINTPVRIQAVVPADVVASGVDIFLEYRYPNGNWLDIRKIPVSSLMVDDPWTPGMERSGLREYRLAAIATAAGTKTVTSTSSTVRASGNIQYSIALLNQTTNNLDVKIPVRWDPTNKDWAYGVVPLSQGEQKTLTYVNPPVGTAFSMILNRQKCFSGCDDYFMDFTWAPTGLQPCTTNQPHFASGGDYSVTLSDDINGQGGGLFGGWKVGKIQGPLAGPGATTDACTFTTRTRIGTWLANHPVEGVVIIAAIVVLVAVTVFVGAELLAAAPAGAAEAVGDTAIVDSTVAADGSAAAETAVGGADAGAFIEQPQIEVLDTQGQRLQFLFNM